MLLSLEAVEKVYGKSPVLTGVDLTLNAQEVIAVNGRNGSGKTTLLRLLLGLTFPSQGRLIRKAKRCGYVPERVPAPPFNATDYLLHMAAIRGLRRSQAMVTIDSYADRLGLDPWLGIRIPDLSKGTRQKVGIVQALLGEPEILVLDEPWSALDQPAQVELNKIIEENRARGCCVLVTDHRDGLSTIAMDRILHVEHKQVFETDLEGPKI